MSARAERGRSATRCTEDPRMLVFGEDVGRLGGVFRVTDGLQDEFGEERVFDTPIAEAGDRGRGGRAGARRMEAVVEMQFDGFSYPALDQVIEPRREVPEPHARPPGDADRDPHPVVRRDRRQGAPRREPRDVLRAHGRAEGRGPVDPARRVPPAAAVDRRPRPGGLPGAEEPLLVEGGRRAHGRRTRRSAPGAGAPGRRRVHGRRVRRDGRAVASRPRRARRGGHRGAGRRPALAVAARRAALGRARGRRGARSWCTRRR